MTGIRLFTVKEAADAIAAELNISDDEDRAYAARCHAAALVDAIGSNAIVYRDSISRLPIRRDGIAAVLVACICVISTDDLNAWLDSKGIGVQLDATESSNAASVESGSATVDRPTSAELSTALGPYLSAGRDTEWLRKRLGEARRYRRLQNYREMALEGNQPIARWEVGGVVLHLIESGDLTRERAKAALTEHFPRYLYALEELPPIAARQPANWIPNGIA
ncbi:hypothetical protein BZM27_47980 [Paraburkholderia steynii]|uniref:Uncharacterized protein n=1 Tax=Paraburkholderia steynii TaxID=1245441 RepID=A0A4R0X462_9BURK|nr:hypothetical protein BZM27_47980 [Paraburkholderia steynii]